MSKLLIYPFSIETAPLTRYYKEFTSYDEIFTVVEKNMESQIGKDVSFMDGGSHVGIDLSTNFEDLVTIANDILFYGTFYNKDESIAYLDTAKRMKKNIFLCDCFHDGVDYNMDNFEVLKPNEYTYNINLNNKFCRISVPVIFVIGAGQQCNKFNIQLDLRKTFMDLGYEVSQVGTKPYSKMFGFHPIPQFADYPLWKKVLSYNRFFRNLVNTENPDVLIVGAPGGIIPINDWHNELFGETAIAISKSLRPDITIFSLYYGKYEKNSLIEISDYSRYALDAPIDYFHLSNSKLVVEQDMQTRSYLLTDSNRILDTNQNLGIDIFNVFNDTSSDVLYEKIVKQLQENIEVL